MYILCEVSFLKKDFENIYRKLDEFMKNKEGVTEENMQEALDEFIGLYNSKQIEEDDFDKANNLLDEAHEAETEKEARRLAKKALKLKPDFIDAKLFLCDLEDDMFKRIRMLDDVILEAKKQLEAGNYFTKENIGHFYGIWETRPYMRCLFAKASLYLELGKISLARECFEEIIKLNNDDNMGARYYLMAIYAFFEDEKKALDLFKKYNKENSFSFKASLMMLYYKLDDEKKAKKYLKEANTLNKNFIKILIQNIKEEEYEEFMMNGYFSRGDKSEIFDFINVAGFVMMTSPEIVQWIVKNSKKA